MILGALVSLLIRKKAKHRQLKRLIDLYYRLPGYYICNKGQGWIGNANDDAIIQRDDHIPQGTVRNNDSSLGVLG